MNQQKTNSRGARGLLLCAAFGLLAGAALGSLELTLRLWGNEDPSVARRALGLCLYAATWTGLFGGVVGLAAGLVARVGSGRDWVTSREGEGPLRAGTVVGLLLPTAVLLLPEEPLARQPGTIRLLLLLLIVAGACLAGWFVARRLSARPGGAATTFLRGLWRPIPCAITCALLLFAGAMPIARAQARVVEEARPEPVPLAPRMQAAPDVLVVVVDTLRADVLGCYGGSANTPNIDALAARGTLFEDASAPSSWTIPSVASLLTGTMPYRHGCDDFGTRLADDVRSLPEVLRETGYRCLASVGNPMVGASAGFGRGFDVYDVYAHEVEERLFAPRLLRAALGVVGISHGERSLLPWFEAGFPFLSSRLTYYALDGDLNRRTRKHAWPQDDRPTFLYVQYVAPHTPYLEHPLSLGKSELPQNEAYVDQMRARYRAEVEYTDRVLGELLDELAESRALEETLVVVTSDHGEEFLEHGRFEHGYNLHRETIQVPLILAGPGVAQSLRVAGNANLVDVAPTVLELLGVEAPGSFTGRSLAPLFEADADFAEQPAYAEISSRFLTPGSRTFSISHRGWKIVRKVDLDGVVLEQSVYDLSIDPQETDPLETAPAAVEPLLEQLDTFAGLTRGEGGTRPSDEVHERMQALGYTGEDQSE